jgi:Family of unknown function (DUF6677)
LAATKGSGSGEAARQAAANPWLAAVAAWALPGAGHFYLGKRGRAATFLVLVFSTLAVGWSLDGKLYQLASGGVLSLLGALGQAGLGAAYFILRFVLGYQGTVTAPGFEYGTAFLLTAGLMNVLLVLDAWDIARGQKE